jgi:hypothetical protein
MWATSAAGHGEIGEHLALAPVGGRVAFLSALTPVQVPSALLQAGSVEIWDVEKKTGGKTNIKAVDQGLAWFPDGKRLAYVKLVDLKDPFLSEQAGDSFGKTFQAWDKVPAVFIHDVNAGTESFLHVGWRPVVSGDGREVLVSDWEGAWRLVDVTTGKSTPTTWPGVAWVGAIGMPAKGVVLSWCLPTEGTKIRYTENNSPLVGPKQMLSLKLARLNSHEFQTVVPYLDPRDDLSYGEVKKKSRALAGREKESNRFATAIGTHRLYDGKLTLEIYKDLDRLNYRVTRVARKGAVTKESVAPKQPFMDKEADWFAFAESNDIVWIFNGRNVLNRVIFHEMGLTTTDSVVVPGIVKEAPKDVQDRLPTTFREKFTDE